MEKRPLSRVERREDTLVRLNLVRKDQWRGATVHADKDVSVYP